MTLISGVGRNWPDETASQNLPEFQEGREEVSDKRVQAVLTYAELTQLIGATERGRIEAVVADPVKRLVQIIFSASGSADGIEPWVIPFYALQPSPPSTHTSEELHEVRVAIENQIIELRRNYDDDGELWGIADSEIYEALGSILDAIRSSPPSTHTSDGSPESTESTAGES